MLHERIFLDDTDDRVFIDTYVANDKSFERDAIIVIPGGGYGAICTQREGEPVALAYVAHGFNAFVLNYRVGRRGDVFPKQLVDVGRAIIYVKENAEKFGINPKRVFTVGFSAGGHLSGSSAIMYNALEVVEALGISGEENKPTASILAYPVVTANLEQTHKPSFKNLLGKPFEEITDDEKFRFSLETAVRPDSAPMFLWHTREDTLVPLNGTLLLAQAAKDAGVNVSAHISPYGPHGLSVASGITECAVAQYNQPLAQNWISDSVAWIKTI